MKLYLLSKPHSTECIKASFTLKKGKFSRNRNALCYLSLAVFLSEDPLKHLRIRITDRIQPFGHIPVHYQVADKNKKLA